MARIHFLLFLCSLWAVYVDFHGLWKIMEGNDGKLVSCIQKDLIGGNI